MLLNPFLTVERTEGKFMFFERYAKSHKPFLVLSTKSERNANLSNLLSNNKLNELMTGKLQYPFTIKESEQDLFEILRENVDMSLEHVNREMLAKFLMMRIYTSAIRIMNHTNYDLSELESKINLTYGNECEIVILITEKDTSDGEEIAFDKKGLVLNFEMSDGELSGVGPFVEREKGDSFHTGTSLMEKSIERTIKRQANYWNRPLEEVVVDTSVSGMVDYFSDYITIASPFFYRKVSLEKDRANLFKRFYLK